MIYEMPFEGAPRKLRIVSNNVSFGMPPSADEEIEQRLTVNARGGVWFSAYCFGEGFGAHRKARTRTFNIGEDVAMEVLERVAAYFGNVRDELFATDIGDWSAEITNAGGATFRFSGSLCADIEKGTDELSDFIRNALGMDNLFIFDGKTTLIDCRNRGAYLQALPPD